MIPKIQANVDRYFAVAVLFATSLISFGIIGGARILHSDDWSSLIDPYVFHYLNPIHWETRRPFDLSYFWALAGLFGVRIEYYYLVNFLILFLSGWMLYKLLKRIFPETPWIALSIALVYLVFPVDYTRTWLSVSFIHFIWLISLCALWLLLDFATSGKKWKLIAAVIGIAAPLVAYEGQLGVIALAIVVIALFTPQISTRRRIIILSVLSVGVMLIVWRVFIQPSFLNVNDSYVNEMQITPSILWERLWHAFKIFAIGWTSPLGLYLNISKLQAFLLSWGGCLVFFAAAYLLFRPSKKEQSEPIHKRPILKKMLYGAILGGLLWIAGYVPVISVYNPVLDGVTSRVNFFSIVGASLLLGSVITIFAVLIAKSLSHAQIMTAAALIPLVIHGVGIELWAQNEYRSAWNIQKQIWNGVFKTLPGIKDGTTVFIVMPGYRGKPRLFERKPLVAEWEVQSGMVVLYNNVRIYGRYYYRDIPYPQSELLSTGIKQFYSTQIIPYEKTIFVYFDPDSKEIQLVERIEDVIRLPFSVKNYRPQDNILQLKPSSTIYRWLVQD